MKNIYKCWIFWLPCLIARGCRGNIVHASGYLQSWLILLSHNWGSPKRGLLALKSKPRTYFYLGFEIITHTVPKLSQMIPTDAWLNDNIIGIDSLQWQTWTQRELMRTVCFGHAMCYFKPQYRTIHTLLFDSTHEITMKHREHVSCEDVFLTSLVISSTEPSMCGMSWD